MGGNFPNFNLDQSITLLANDKFSKYIPEENIVAYNTFETLKSRIHTLNNALNVGNKNLNQKILQMKDKIYNLTKENNQLKEDAGKQILTVEAQNTVDTLQKE